MMKRCLPLATIPFLLLSCRPSDPAAPTPAPAPTSAPVVAETPAAPAAPDWTGKVWTATDSPDLPGVMRVFLPDGTLVMDSCWETYRLAQWRQVSDRSLVIVEDSQEIPVEILEATGNALRLRLTLVAGETKDEAYQAAAVPFVCPDMPR